MKGQARRDPRHPTDPWVLLGDWWLKDTSHLGSLPGRLGRLGPARLRHRVTQAPLLPHPSRGRRGESGDRGRVHAGQGSAPLHACPVPITGMHRPFWRRGWQKRWHRLPRRAEGVIHAMAWIDRSLGRDGSSALRGEGMLRHGATEAADGRGACPGMTGLMPGDGCGHPLAWQGGGDGPGRASRRFARPKRLTRQGMPWQA
jgi:hypothetical protein